MTGSVLKLNFRLSSKILLKIFQKCSEIYCVILFYTTKLVRTYSRRGLLSKRDRNARSNELEQQNLHKD